MSHSSEKLVVRPYNKISSVSEADTLIFRYLFGEERFQNFHRFADRHCLVLGTHSEDKARVAARNRKNYLRNEFLTKPRSIIRALYQHGISEIAAAVESDLTGFLNFHMQKAKSTPTKSNISKKSIATRSVQNKKVTLEAEDDSIHSDASSENQEGGFAKNLCKVSMSTSSHSIPSVCQEYMINLEEPDLTPGNVLPLLCKEVKGDGVSCDKLCLKLQNIDLEDFKSRFYSARLADDFASVLITRPKIPRYERDREEVEQFYEQQKKIANTKAPKGNPGWACDAAYTAQLKIVAGYEEDNKVLLTTLQYHFPNGMTCSNKFFNDGASNDYKLTPKIVAFKRDHQFFASLILEMVIDGSVSFYGAKRVGAEADEVLDLIAGMSM